MLTAIVVEDSRLARHGLIRLLQSHEEVEVIGDAECVLGAIKLIAKQKPEVIFLDIHMPGENGFELLEQLDYSPKVIFTTAYNEHALRSFDYNVVDYLLKPISKPRLADAIAKLSINMDEGDAISQQAAAEDTTPTMTMDSKVFIKDGDECHLIPLASIDLFESCKNYTRVFFGQKNAYIKKPLASVLLRLPAADFIQVNRQNIINLNSITDVHLGVSDTCNVVINNKTTVTVSRRNLATLRMQLGF